MAKNGGDDFSREEYKPNHEMDQKARRRHIEDRLNAMKWQESSLLRQNSFRTATLLGFSTTLAIAILIFITNLYFEEKSVDLTLPDKFNGLLFATEFSDKDVPVILDNKNFQFKLNEEIENLLQLKLNELNKNGGVSNKLEVAEIELQFRKQAQMISTSVDEIKILKQSINPTNPTEVLQIARLADRIIAIEQTLINQNLALGERFNLISKSLTERIDASTQTLRDTNTTIIYSVSGVLAFMFVSLLIFWFNEAIRKLFNRQDIAPLVSETDPDPEDNSN